MDPGSERRLAAVIELGSTSIRMAVGSRDRSVQAGGRRHRVRTTLDLPVGLGRESFTSEVISGETTERCVAAVGKFLGVLKERGVDLADLRLVATSAVREARNRDAFTDRIRIATGLPVQVLDEVEVSRLTYLAVRPLLAREAFFRRSTTLVVEVGGGSTDILAFRRGHVHSAHVHRLGSLRMHGELGDFSGLPGGEALLSDYAAGPVDQMAAGLQPLAPPVHVVALGSEPRLLRRLDGGGGPVAGAGLARLEVAAIRRFLRRGVRLTTSELAREYGISEHQSETLLPALAIYEALARTVGARTLAIAECSLRDGVLADLFAGGAWEDEFRRQAISSTLVLARKYRVNLPHARAVAANALAILEVMDGPVAFDPDDALLLEVAALLHEIGAFVNPRSFHKHSLYLIENSEIFGISTHAIRLVARIARYHRRATPRPTHEEYADLPSEDRVRIAKLAAILRVADALAFDHETGVGVPACAIRGETLHLSVDAGADLTLMTRQLEARSAMFQSVFGLRVVLRAATGSRDTES